MTEKTNNKILYAVFKVDSNGDPIKNCFFISKESYYYHKQFNNLKLSDDKKDKLKTVLEYLLASLVEKKNK